MKQPFGPLNAEINLAQEEFSEINLAQEEFSEITLGAKENPEINLAQEEFSEITLDVEENPEITLDVEENPKITLAEEEFSKEISEIFNSPEFAYAVLATMYANTHHNDPNEFQNLKALEILEEFAKQSPDDELSENILKLSEFAKNNKELDRNFSLVADLIRITAGAIALSASIYESTAKNDDSETTKLNSTSEIVGIISLATQIIASPITANSGYKASFTGHFTDEMANAFKRVATLLHNKIDRQEIDRSSHRTFSNPNHQTLRRFFFRNNDQAETSFSRRVNPETEAETSFSRRVNPETDHDNHRSHSGSTYRNFGTFLNVNSMAMSSYRMLSELKHLTESNPLLNNLNSSILALTAPVLSIIGKFSSLRAAKIRDEEVCKKISTAKKEMSADFARIFKKAKVLEASFDLSISPKDATIALKSELVAIGKKMEEEAEKKRSESGMAMSTKIFFNYMKDTVYGLSYEAIKFFYDTVPSLWIVNSSTTTQSQISQPQTDLELQNKPSELHLKNIDEIKKQIGSDEDINSFRNSSALTDLLSQISRIEKNLLSHPRKLNTKRVEEQDPVLTRPTVFPIGEFPPIPDSTYPTNEAAANTSKKEEPSTSLTEPQRSRSLSPKTTKVKS